MGYYTTDFYGSVTVEPPLNQAEITYLRKFSDTRRMDRKRGPYFVEGSGLFGQGQDEDIRDYNRPPAGQPGLWCKWEPTDDGTAIRWTGEEKFYDATEWMQYLIDHFLKPGARAARTGGFEGFTFDHVVNGTIDAYGEESGDVWRLVVEDNVARAVQVELVWSE